MCEAHSLFIQTCDNGPPGIKPLADSRPEEVSRLSDLLAGAHQLEYLSECRVNLLSVAWLHSSHDERLEPSGIVCQTARKGLDESPTTGHGVRDHNAGDTVAVIEH